MLSDKVLMLRKIASGTGRDGYLVRITYGVEPKTLSTSPHRSPTSASRSRNPAEPRIARQQPLARM